MTAKRFTVQSECNFSASMSTRSLVVWGSMPIYFTDASSTRCALYPSHHHFVNKSELVFVVHVIQQICYEHTPTKPGISGSAGQW